MAIYSEYSSVLPLAHSGIAEVEAKTAASFETELFWVFLCSATLGGGGGRGGALGQWRGLGGGVATVITWVWFSFGSVSLMA